MFNAQNLTIIIDLGLKVTRTKKNKSTPELFHKDKYLKSPNQFENILIYKKTYEEIKLKIEEFVDYIIVYVLQLKKPPAEHYNCCLLLIDFNAIKHFRYFYELFSSCLLSYKEITILRIAPKNIFPIFVSGYGSGIIFNGGYLFSNISIINNGVCIFNKEIPIGISYLEKQFKNMILSDDILKGEILPEEFDSFKNNLNLYIEDILIKNCVIVNKKISNQLLDDSSKLVGEDNYSLIDEYKNLLPFKISFVKRVLIGEKLFDEKEGNISYEVLKILLNKVPCEIKRKICSNIILSGGMCMLLGFYQRFIDEINEFLLNEEFQRLNTIKNDIKIHKIIYPRNCLCWVGASLVSNFENVNFSNREIIKDQQDNINKEISSLFD
jgi:actin-related protein